MTVLQKLKTPIFFGIPPFPGDCPQEDAQNIVASSLIRDAWEIDMLQWCRVVVPLFTSWRANFPSSVPSNRHGLAHLLTTWNCSSTTCLNKLRGVTLQNLIKHTARLMKCNAWTEFRFRNTDFWEERVTDAPEVVPESIDIGVTLDEQARLKASFLTAILGENDTWKDHLQVPELILQ